MIEASAMRRPSSPCTRSSGSTTASASSAGPILQVPTGWKIVVPMSPAAFANSSSLWSSGPGRYSSGWKRRRAFGRHDAAGQPDRIDRHPPVLFGAEVVELDRGVGARLRAPDPDMSAAGRAQVAHRGGEGREGMQRLAELVQAQGLDVILQIGRVEAGIAPGETAELGGCGGHRPAPEQGIFPGHAGAAEQCPRARSLSVSVFLTL